MTSMCRDSRRQLLAEGVSEPEHAQSMAVLDEKRDSAQVARVAEPWTSSWDVEKGALLPQTSENASASPDPRSNQRRSLRRAAYLVLCYAAAVFLCRRVLGPFPFSPISSLTHDSARLLDRCSSLPEIPDSTYAARRNALAAELAVGAHTDVYLAEPGASAGYFAGIGSGEWHLSERTFLVVVVPRRPAAAAGGAESVAPGHRIVVLTPEFEADRAKLLRIPGAHASANASTEVTYLSWPEAGSPFTVLARYLAGMDGAGSVHRIHVDPYVRSFISSGLQMAIAGQAGLEHVTVDVASDKVGSIRERKDRHEVELLQCANELTLEAIKRTRDKMYIGIKESQTRAILERHMAKLGLEDGSGLVLFGENAALPHGSGTDRALGKRDFALIDTGGKFRGYVADVTRTFALDKSEIPDANMRIWSTVHAAQRKAHEAVRAGVTGRSLDQAARLEVAERATRPEEAHGFTHRLGHGIGLEGHESPYLVGSNNHELLPGNTFSNEPGVYILGEVGVRLEDCFVVQEDGTARMFTGQARDPWHI